MDSEELCHAFAEFFFDVGSIRTPHQQNPDRNPGGILNPTFRLADCLPGGFPLGPAVDPVVDPGSCGNYAADLPDS